VYIQFKSLRTRLADFAGAVDPNGKDKFFVTYCSGFPCHHFMEAAEILVKQGFQPQGYPGGIQEWAESGLPVEGTQVK